MKTTLPERTIHEGHSAPAYNTLLVSDTFIIGKLGKLRILQGRAAPAVKSRLYENTEVRYNNALFFISRAFALSPFTTVETPSSLSGQELRFPDATLSRGHRIFIGRGFIGYPKGRNRDIKLVN